MMIRKFLLSMIICIAISTSNTNAAIIVAPGEPDVINEIGTVYSGTIPDSTSIGSNFYIGKTAGGELTIDNGSDLTNNMTYLAYENGSFGKITITNTGSTWTNTGDLTVGNYGNAEMNISDGASVSNTGAYIGYAVGKNGTVNITGANSTWTSSDTMYVGFEGIATINITNGANVTSNNVKAAHLFNSQAEINLQDTNSKWEITGDLILGRQDDAVLDIESGAELTSNTSTTADGTLATANINITGADSKWTNTNTLYLSKNGTTNLTIENGGALTNGNGILGQNNGSQATVNVTGATSTWTNSGNLTVGYEGNAEINISNGATVSNTAAHLGYFNGGIGTVNITGANSTWTSSGHLYVGSDGDGTLNISNGAEVESQLSYIGNSVSSTGIVTIEDANSSWITQSALSVGSTGTGTLNIENGAYVKSEDAYLGIISTGQAGINLKDSNSKWEITDNLILAEQGRAVLNIESGAELTSNTSTTTDGGSGSAYINITGAASKWINTNSLYISKNGRTDLNIEDGGLLISEDGIVALNDGSEATVNVTGTNSAWTNTSGLYLGGAGTSSTGIARLNISDDAQVSATNATLWTNSSLSGDSSLNLDSGNGTLDVYGTIKPGDHVGSLAPAGIGPTVHIDTLTVNGNVNFNTDSILEVEVDNAGNSDLLDVTGNVVINGGTIKAISAETITSGYNYTILTASDITGEFDTLDTALLQLDSSITSVNTDYSDSTKLLLKLSATSFNDPTIIKTKNQSSIATSLQFAADSIVNPIQGITTPLQALSTNDQLRNAYTQLSAQNLTSLAPITRIGGSKFTNTIYNRMQNNNSLTMTNNQSPFLASANLSNPNSSIIDALGSTQNMFAIGNNSDYYSNSSYGFWGKGFGVIGDRETDKSFNGYQYQTYGTSFGFDKQFNESLLAGFAFGYSNSNVDYASSRDESEIDSKYAALYASFDADEYYIDGTLALSDLDYETDRYVDVTGEHLKGDYSGSEFAGQIEAGYNFMWKGIDVQPLAGFEIGYLTQDSYNETGGVSALKFKKETSESYKSSLGLELTKPIYSRNHNTLTAQLRGRWMHEFGDTYSSQTCGFIGSGSYFTIEDKKMDPDSGLFGTGIKLETTKGYQIFVDYDIMLNSDNVAHMFTAGLEYRW